MKEKQNLEQKNQNILSSLIFNQDLGSFSNANMTDEAI